MLYTSQKVHKKLVFSFNHTMEVFSTIATEEDLRSVVETFGEKKQSIVSE